MEPLWELVDRAITASQDDQGEFDNPEKAELEKLSKWLKKNAIFDVWHLD